MEKQLLKSMQAFLGIGAIMGWLAVVFQLYLLLLNRATSVPEAIIRFFSFYTILTNILVAVCLTVLLLKPKSRWGNFFSQSTKITAIAVYISIVGIVYNTLLRFTWDPQGLQRVVDELLHLVVPVWFILYWFIFAPKTKLQWKNVFPWLIYPLAYVLCIFIRGALSGFYPYPFIDVNVLGYYNAFLNSIGLSLAFLSISLLFVAIAKIINRTLY